MREYNDQPRPETTDSQTTTNARAPGRERDRPRYDTQSDDDAEPQICRGMD